MMSYDKSSPNAKIGRSNSNNPEFLEKLVREGKTNREISLILDLDYGSVASILYRYGIKRDPKAKNVTYDAVDAAKDVVAQVYNDILALFQK